MSDMQEAWERDLDWLRKNLGRVDENDAEDFCERVAVMISEGKAETTARYMAMVLIRDKRNGRQK